LVLIEKDEAKESAILVVAPQVEATWNITMLATGGPSVPVVWSLPPGKYTDVYGKKTIRATRPVIVFLQYEAWGIVYAWTNNRVAKMWISEFLHRWHLAPMCRPDGYLPGVRKHGTPTSEVFNHGNLVSTPD